MDDRNDAPDGDRLFQAAFQYSAVGMALVDLQGRYLKVNDALCGIVGYTRDELLKLDFQTITHPADLDSDLALLGRLQRGEIRSYDLEKRYVHRDGRIVWIHLRVMVVRRSDGEPDFFLSQVQDIQRRKAAETDFEAFFNLAPDMIAVGSARGPVERLNPAWQRTLGWTPEELMSQGLIERVHADDQAATRRESEALYAGRPTTGFRNRFRASDGSYHVLEWRSQVSPEGRMIAVARDVTGQLAAEEALRRSALRLAEISATAPAVLFQWYARATGERAFTFVSDRCVDILGLEAEAIRPDWSNLGLLPDDAMRLEVSIRTGVAARAPWTCDVRRGGDDAASAGGTGEVRWLRFHARPVLATPAEVRYSGVILDVTAERAAMRKLEASEERFRALAEGSIQGIVVGDVARDLRPLYANDAAARMLGYDSADELLALPSLSAVAPTETLARAVSGWNRLVRGETLHIEARVELRHRTGRPLWAELMGTVIVWEGAPALQMTVVDVTERMRIEAELERLATTDPLTGLGNRRPFVELAERELRRSARHPSPLALLLIDADHFKRVNDRHGHAAGDHVLRTLGAALRGAVRDIDLVCRWGGEEFAVLLVGSDLGGAVETAERIRRTCEALVIEHEGVALPVTVSVGVTERRSGEGSLEAIVARADRALYAAKESGRNASAVEP